MGNVSEMLLLISPLPFNYNQCYLSVLFFNMMRFELCLVSSLSINNNDMRQENNQTNCVLSLIYNDHFAFRVMHKSTF